MTTIPVRVPEEVHGEVIAAARVLGCNAADLLAQAWDAYRQSPDFRADFEQAQKAFSVGDFDALAHRIHEQTVARAEQRAALVEDLRKPQ